MSSSLSAPRKQNRDTWEVSKSVGPMVHFLLLFSFSPLPKSQGAHLKKIALISQCKKCPPFFLFQIRAITPSKSEKPPTCMPTLTQMGSNVPHIGAGELQRAEITAQETLPCWGGKAGSKCLPASLRARTTAKGEGWGKQVHSSALLWEEERSFVFLLPFFRNISTHSLRQGEGERKENPPSMPGLSQWRRQPSSWPARLTELPRWLRWNFNASNGKTHQWWFKNYPAV